MLSTYNVLHLIRYQKFRCWNGTILVHRRYASEYVRLTGELPSQRPVTRSFDVFFDLRLDKRPSKQSWGCWFEPPSHHSLWRHCNELLLDRGETLADEYQYIACKITKIRDRSKIVYEMINSKAFISTRLYKIHIFECMGKIFHEALTHLHTKICITPNKTPNQSTFPGIEWNWHQTNFQTPDYTKSPKIIDEKLIMYISALTLEYQPDSWMEK